ncbi:MAG: prolipoprotein diacylglyceryl transferase [Bacteroidales bacterium]|jgi:prolipoprotein diacylglyceryl transferase|nr:prolipoprotein diacylglyceryl transferase [Bacteroidales bacterium]
MIDFLAYVTWTVDPVAFTLEPLEIRWYSIFLLVGFALAFFTLSREFKLEKVPPIIMDNFGFYTILWTLVGLRIGHFLFYERSYFIEAPLQILLPFDKDWNFIGYQGLASHGGVIAIILYVSYFSWKHKINIFWLLDRVAVAVMIAAAFVRVGNLMNHEIVGSITEVDWAFNFTLGGYGVADTLRHPAQLYEAVVYLFTYFGLVFYYFRMAKGDVSPGRITGILLIVVFLARFIIEFFKEVQVAKEAAMRLDIGQILSIPFVLLGIGLLIYSIINRNNIPHYDPSKDPSLKKGNS